MRFPKNIKEFFEETGSWIFISGKGTYETEWDWKTKFSTFIGSKPVLIFERYRVDEDSVQIFRRVKYLTIRRKTKEFEIYTKNIEKAYTIRRRIGINPYLRVEIVSWERVLEALNNILYVLEYDKKRFKSPKISRLERKIKTLMGGLENVFQFEL